MDRIIVIGGWDRLYQQLVSAGFKIDIIAKEEHPYFPVFVSPHMDYDDISLYIQSLKYTVKYIVCYEEALLELTAKLAVKFSLPSNSMGAVENTIDKFKMRNALSGLGLNPIYTELTDIQNFNKFPIILKPKKGTASLNVTSVSSLTELKSIKIDEPQNYMIEEMMSGVEVSVECISRGGVHRILGITKKELFQNSFVEKGHYFPYEMPSDVKENLYSTIEQVLNRLNIDNGPTHTEVFISGSDFKIVETHTRSGGDYIYDLVLLSTGINLFTDWLSDDLFAKQAHNNSSYVRFFAPGTLTKKSAFTDDLSSLQRFCVYKIKGETMLNSSSDRSGYSLFSGSDQSALITQANTLEERLTC